MKISNLDLMLTLLVISTAPLDIVGIIENRPSISPWWILLTIKVTYLAFTLAKILYKKDIT